MNDCLQWSVKRCIRAGLMIGVTGLLWGCGKPASSSDGKSAAIAPSGVGQEKVFYVKGVIKGVEQAGAILDIEHEEIPNYMEAMTMPFDVKNTNEVLNLTTNDQIHFRLVVTEDDSWIDQITRIGRVMNLSDTNRAAFRLVREVKPLEVGDTFPNYPLTNQFGRAFQTDDYRGQVLAFTLIFTRCPLPDFCPRISKNIKRIQAELTGKENTVTNWQLLSISFDVDFDTPQVLNSYAKALGANPDRWTFATGALIEIDDITERFGMYFAREQGTFSFNHNMRTVIVDPNGKIHQVFIGNTWQVEDVIRSIRTAAAVKPSP